MKNSKLIITLKICFLVAFVLVARNSTISFYAESPEILSTEGVSLSEDESQKQQVNDIVVANNTQIINRDAELDQKRALIEAEEVQKNEEDLLAYGILSKYYGAQYERSIIITDYNLDVQFMEAMINLLNGNTISLNESSILKQYLCRRIDWINDEYLRSTINSVLG